MALKSIVHMLHSINEAGLGKSTENRFKKVGKQGHVDWAIWTAMESPWRAVSGGENDYMCIEISLSGYQVRKGAKLEARKLECRCWWFVPEMWNANKEKYINSNYICEK